MLFKFLRKRKVPTAKPSLEDVQLDIESIPEAVTVVEGFPRIDWTRVQQAAAAYASHPAIDAIWTELAAQWLGIIRGRQREQYRIYESEHLLLLSAQSAGPARRLLETGDAAFERLRGLLQREPASRGHGKHVVLLLAQRDEYYDYVSYFHPESDRVRGTSAGMHFSSGYRHTAINAGSSQVLHTLVHELAHEMVFDLPLPRWVNEGVAQFAEDLVPGYRPLMLDARQVRLQRRYWSWFGLNHFWDGSAFLHASSQRLSYQLADVLFRNLAGHRDRSRQLSRFLATAHRRDSGWAAAQEVFGITPAVLVEEFLGPGATNSRSAQSAFRLS